MSRLSKLLAVPVLALALALGVALGAVAHPVGGSSALAGPAAPPAQAAGGEPRTVAVGGEGRVAVTPDVAYAVFGVDTTSANLG